MMTLELIQILKKLTLCLIVYFPTVTLSGFFEAWVAKKVGDDLPKKLGYLTLNPMIHFSPIGFICLILGNVFGSYFTFFWGLPGWGQYIPLNPPSKPWYYNVFEFLARGFAHFILLVITLSAIILFIKTGPHQSALMLSTIETLQLFLQQNLILAGGYLSIGTVRIIFHRFFPNFHIFKTENFFVGLALIVGTLFLVSKAIQTIVPVVIHCIYSLMFH